MSMRCRIASATPTIPIVEEFASNFGGSTQRARLEEPHSRTTSRCSRASDLNLGNRETPFLGQRLFLTNLQQSYGVRGSGVFSKFLFTSNALTWLDVYGQFLYSRPETDTNYQQFNTGNFAISNGALFVTSQQFALASSARMPHTAGSAGAEIRPWRRARIMVSWLTDRIENNGTVEFRLVSAQRLQPVGRGLDS